MKRTRKQKAADLAELLKDRDDARADAAQHYAGLKYDAATKSIREEMQKSIARSIFPGICWNPVYPPPAPPTEEDLAAFERECYGEIVPYADFPEWERPFVKAFVEGSGDPRTPRGIFSDANRVTF